MSSIVNPHVFREYDIRGHAERDLPDELVRDLGRALGTFWARRGGRRVAVGRDCRLSSPRLFAALVEGLLETGVRAVDLGVVPTPLMYFAVHAWDLDGGVQITGSHNPPEDNGFKMMAGRATMSGEDIQALGAFVRRRDFTRAPGGTIVERDVLPEYVGFVEGNVRLARGDLRVAIDAGNGAAGPTALAALRAAGIEPRALLCEPDGRFPVHHPDPSMPRNLQLLRDTVIEEGLDVGIAYDGDGDRIGVIDAKGRILYGDRLLILLSRHLLRERPGAAVLGEVKCSQTLYDDIAAHGGRPILWKTGHSLIKKKMKEEGVLLAGEMSGHVFYADRFFGFDDAVYATLRLLEILAATDRPLHELLDDVPETFSTPELRVDCADEEKFAVVDRVRERFEVEHEVITVDGARILFDGGWGLVRASNTQPALVLRFEATTEVRLHEIRDAVEGVIEEVR
ncbi:MAG: phosphomannomutase/phosphoglucomutase [Sandaracinaceae bacterium]|nr:phosphomannomutase/phosphoglucomutase [Sandaracinaceae bacterium]